MSSEEREVKRLRIRGTVHGVGYRVWVEREALALGLKGWVRNRRDGSVEVIAGGPPAAVANLIERCRSGPPLAKVEFDRHRGGERARPRLPPPAGEFLAARDGVGRALSLPGFGEGRVGFLLFLLPPSAMRFRKDPTPPSPKTGREKQILRFSPPRTPPRILAATPRRPQASTPCSPARAGSSRRSAGRRRRRGRCR